MTRSLLAATAVVVAGMTASAQAQSPFPAASQQSVFPAPSQQQSVFPAPSQQNTLPSGQAPQQAQFGAPPPRTAANPICGEFPKLRDMAQKKVAVVQQIGAHKPPDRAKMCAAVTAFSAAEAVVVKFLETHKADCGVPVEAVTNAKQVHAGTEKFRETVCAEGPKPKIPTLSDAIATTPVDTPKNTKASTGTFNTLTGNPLGN